MILCSSCFSEAGFATAVAVEPRSTCEKCGESCLGYVTPPVAGTGMIDHDFHAHSNEVDKATWRSLAVIQDKDITAMIEFLKGTGWSGLLVAELTAMLEELLLLRKKVRDAA